MNYNRLEPPITFRLRGRPVANNSRLEIRTIGEQNNAFTVPHHSVNVVKNKKKGKFYFIQNGVAINVLNNGHILYRGRGNGLIRLNRRNNAEDVSEATGLYRCCLPDGCGEEKCIQITLI